MRYLPIIVLILCAGCNVRVFNFVDVPERRLKDFSKIVIDSSYKLYTRTVCKSGLLNFIDCRPYHLKDTNRVEIEYLLISEKEGLAIYLSMPPDPKLKLYNHPGFDNLHEINTWYLSKILIGKVSFANKTISFRYNHKSGYTVVFSSTSDQINFVTLQGWHKEGVSHIDLKQAIALPPMFRLQKEPVLVFEKFVENMPPQIEKTVIKGNSFLISNNWRKGIYFLLSKSWENKKDSIIKFRRNRLETNIW